MTIRRGNKSIVILLILCLLLLGMYPSKGRVDSFFATPNSSPVSAVTNSTISSPGSNVAPKQAYTRETIMQYETVLAPQQNVRRISPRLGLRSFYILSIENSLLQCVFLPTATLAHHTLDGFISNAIIVTYIHNQDGEKV